MVKNVDQTDNFGFKSKNEFAKRRNHDKQETSNLNIKTMVIWISIIILIFIILSGLTISGYIAWNEFEHNPIWIKMVKTYLAVLFSPIYLSYVFIKSVVLDLPR